MTKKSGSYITVVRCPLSSTTTNFNYGKTTMTATVVDEQPKPKVEN